MITIGEAIARTRNQIKSSKNDAFITDRFLYSLIMKHAKLLMRRQDSLNRIMKFNSVFQKLKYVELIDVDRIEANCNCVQSGCTFKRTKNKLPDIIEGYFGPLIRFVGSIDGATEVHPTFAKTFEEMTKVKLFKYNKDKYYWYSEGYLYFPNLDWDAVMVEGLFEGDVSKYDCDVNNDCDYIQQKKINVPESLFSEIEQLVLRDLGIMIQVPQDTQHDKKHTSR